MTKLSDYQKHPENLTEEEKQGFIKLIETTQELSKSFESYNFKIDNKNTIESVSAKFYQEHFVMSAVLESFFYKNEIDYKELNKAIFNYVPEEFMWNITVPFIQTVIIKLIRLGLIVAVETDDKYMPIFKITEDGIKTYQQHTFQSLASSSFYNYQTQRLSKRANFMNVLMLIVTIMSVIVTIWAIIK